MPDDFQAKAKAIGGGLLASFDPDANTGADTPLDDGLFEQKIFQNMVNRTVHVFSVRTYRHPDEAGLSSSNFKKTVRVACISSNLGIARGPDLELSHFRDGCALLKRTATYDADTWIEERRQELHAALSLDPHIVCFPEFAYPPPPQGKNGGWTIEEIDAAVSGRHSYQSMVQTELAGRDPFTFLGSYHCPMTLYNVGLTLPWGGKAGGKLKYITRRRETLAYGAVREDEISTTEDVNGPVVYRKRFPARRLGEQTRVPTGTEFNVFERAFAKMAVIICSDALDLNQFMMLTRSSLDKYNGLEFILVPSYSPEHKGTFRQLCRELSFMTATAVFAVSAEDRGAPMSPTDVYICGTPASEIGPQSTPLMRGLLKSKSFKAGQYSSGTIFDINMKKFRQIRDAHLHLLRPSQTNIQVRSLQ